MPLKNLVWKPVVHDGHRWKIVGLTKFDDDDAYELERSTPLGKVKHHQLVARVKDCQPYQRAGRRTIRGDAPHRDGRPVIFSYSDGVVSVRLKGRRKAFTTTLGGIYDLCARQQAINLKRDRAFAKRTRGR